MEIAQTLLFTGFTKGYWNPDLMLILIEPVAYMYMALAERAGIDPVIDLNEDEEEDAEEEFFGISKDNEKLKRLQRNLKGNIIPAGVIDSEMEEKLETLPTKEEMSLMAEEPVEEKPTIDFAYASVVSIKDIRKGERLDRENIWVKRPGTGDFLAEEYSTLIGREAKKDIDYNTQIKKEHIL